MVNTIVLGQDQPFYKKTGGLFFVCTTEFRKLIPRWDPNDFFNSYRKTKLRKQIIYKWRFWKTHFNRNNFPTGEWAIPVNFSGGGTVNSAWIPRKGKCSFILLLLLFYMIYTLWQKLCVANIRTISWTLNENS